MVTDQHFPGGYNGRILRVDLTQGTVSIEKLDERFCRKYIGGAGFVAHYLYSELKSGSNPLGPDNVLIFANGPLTGTSISGTARNCIGARSPLTGGIAKSEVGGHWGAELAHACIDAIIIKGKASHPVYLNIRDGEASIRDAGYLWGKTTGETAALLRQELGDRKTEVTSIGQAGEKQVLFACIMNGLHDAAGRGGTGAVMGSKNLKAIAVRGRTPNRMVSLDGVVKLRDWLLQNRPLWANFAQFGTAGNGAAIDAMVKTGNVSVKNFREGIFPEAVNLDCKQYMTGMRGCYACAVRCKKVMEFKEPYPLDSAYGGPEYETIGALGTSCYVSDMKAVAKGNELCNAYGLDTISTGMVISFAMECFENGLLTPTDTGGIDLRFGNGEAMCETVRRIGERRGIGEVLALGSLKAAQKIRGGAEKFAMQVKGLEVPMHEPRLKAGLGLGYMVNPHGADHCCNLQDNMYNQPNRRSEQLVRFGLSGPLPADDIGTQKVALFRFVHLTRMLHDCVPICMFLPYDPFQVADITNTVTGWDMTVMEQLRVAERVTTMFRLINEREGFTGREDRLPERFFQGKSGALADKPLDHVKMEKALHYYYTLMGWDPATGVPLPEKVEELGIP